MKILLVTSGYPPEHSGSGKRVHDTYLRLTKINNAIKWNVLTSRKSINSKTVNGPESINVHKGKSSSGLYALISSFPLQKKAAKELIKNGALKNIDLVHCVGFTWLSFFICNEAKKRRIPIIRELTSISDGGKIKSLGGFAFSIIIKKINKLANLLIAISPALKQDVRSSGLDIPVWCRPNPVDKNRFNFPSKKERKKTRNALKKYFTFLSPTDIVILNIGRIRPLKNQLFLIKVLERLPEKYKLIIGGPILNKDKQYLQTIYRRIKNRGLSNRIHIEARFIDKPENYMQGCDIFALPSKHEGLGNVLLESLCCGLPVTSNYIPGVTDWIIETDTNGALFDLSIESAINAIESAEKLIKDRKKISEDAYERYGCEKIDHIFLEHIYRLTKK